MIEIRHCHPKEIERVMAFIDCHWQQGHVLASSRKLMDWQHGEQDGKYNYLIAIREQSLLGILGYITSSRFDKNQEDKNVIWLALWKVIEDSGVVGLGLRMLNTLVKTKPHSMLAVNGINPAHLPMYKALGYKTGELKQYFVTNECIEPRLLKVPGGKSLPKPKTGTSILVEADENDLIAMDSCLLDSNIANVKSPSYFLNRFLKHPFYRYRVFQINGPTHSTALLSTRVAQHGGAKVLRVVDYSGDPKAIASLGTAIKRLMIEEEVEYADFWQWGLPGAHFEQAGFSLNDPEGPIVVPNFFEPYIQRNGRIFFVYKTQKTSPIVICRADGDQDRPNCLIENA